MADSGHVFNERRSDGVPFIYFEETLAYGALPGVVRVELHAAALHRLEAGSVDLSFVPVAHLRCHPAAARILAAALLKSADAAERPDRAPGKSN